MQATAVTIGRVLLGLYFLIPGLTKITGYAGTLDYMVLHNIPLPDVLLPLTIIIQVGGRPCADSRISYSRDSIGPSGTDDLDQHRHARLLEHLPRAQHATRSPKFRQKFRDLCRPTGTVGR